MAGLATSLTLAAKLGMLAKDLIRLSKLAASDLAACAGVVEEAESVTGLATVLPAKLGMCVVMLLAILSMEGGGAGADAGWVEPPIEEVSPANNGMLVAMISVTPARVGKTAPWPNPLTGGRGGASSSVFR